MTFSTADLCDEYSDEIQVLGSEFKSYGKKLAFLVPFVLLKFLKIIY